MDNVKNPTVEEVSVRGEQIVAEITIIVPVYNVEKYIRRCMDSLLAQTFENIEILLIDDVVSTGGTLISTLNALKELNIDIKAAVAVIEKGEGKKLVEKETGIPIFSVVKLDVIDGKVVIEKTIED